MSIAKIKGVTLLSARRAGRVTGGLRLAGCGWDHPKPDFYEHRQNKTCHQRSAQRALRAVPLRGSVDARRGQITRELAMARCEPDVIVGPGFFVRLAAYSYVWHFNPNSVRNPKSHENIPHHPRRVRPARLNPAQHGSRDFGALFLRRSRCAPRHNCSRSQEANRPS